MLLSRCCIHFILLRDANFMQLVVPVSVQHPLGMKAQRLGWMLIEAIRCPFDLVDKAKNVVLPAIKVPQGFSN